MRKHPKDTLLNHLLLDFLRQQAVESFLVLGARNKKCISYLITFFDKEGALLDLTSGKVWEKEKRFITMLMQKCEKRIISIF
jgi:hypothetical protein